MFKIKCQICKIEEVEREKYSKNVTCFLCKQQRNITYNANRTKRLKEYQEKLKAEERKKWYNIHKTLPPWK